jgi:adenylate cyclase
VPEGDAARVQEHAEAATRVRSLLLDLGCSDAEIDQAVSDDVVDLLVVDRMLIPTHRRLTQAEVAETTGISIDLAHRFWRALGFPDVGDDDAAFTEMDVEAIRLFQAMVGMDLVDVETAVQMARVVGSSMARIAEAQTSPGATPILMPTGDSVIDADHFARQADSSIPAMGRLLEYVWRRHLQAATRRAMLVRTRGFEEGTSPIMAVGFADMVGFTMLSQHLSDDELAAVVSRFEQLAHDTVVALGGRVVKMIGDEAMFVVHNATNAAEIGLSLAETYAGDQLLSDVRVSLAIGPVLVQDGDFYGPVVNLASRLVAVANPGTVLVSDDLRTALEDEGAEGFNTRALRVRTLRDFGRVQVWKLSRAGTEPGAERPRNVRWERLGRVVAELDELRGRGERVVHGRLPAVEVDAGAGDAPDRSEATDLEGGRGGSPLVESGGGDPVGTQIEPPVEGGDLSTP